MKYLIIPIVFLVAACSTSPQEINRLDFPYKKNYEAAYFTKVTLLREDGSVQAMGTDTLNFKINKDLSDKGNKTHEWLLLPGMKDNNIPDTMLSYIDSTGLYNYYGPELLPEGAKEIKLISLPLTPGKVWESSYLSFPAKATYLDKDSTIITPAGEFKTFAIQYEFFPTYMNTYEFIKDLTKNEIRAVWVDYYSQEVGKVLTQLDFYVTDRKSGKRLWKIQSSNSYLIKIKIP
jgi:hypothetical protein